MKITDWESEIEKIDWLILSHVILQDDDDLLSITVKIRFMILDFSVLEFYESIDYQTNRYKYGYQWMDKDKKLIRRWDNNLHHSHISTYPFHQHIETDENVHPSEEMTLAKVFDFISKNLA